MIKEKINPGSGGLPPVKKKYEPEEQKLIAEATESYGLRPVADAYGVSWQAVAAWRRRYCNNSVKPQKKTEEQAKVIIQSPTGQEITSDEILAKVEASMPNGGRADTVYVRVDENAAYWVRGEENGAVSLWQ
ncbi:MAG: hypothetical protein IKN30_01215 [Synergistaceae bacterium]|nr:hypothetical protein [Synergistaceae bacterium]